MSINASNYVVTYNEPYAPRISVNVQTVTSAEFESAVAIYNEEAAAYVSDYRVTIANKTYIEDRLKKDLCSDKEGLTNGGIDYESNTIILHQKANEVYEYSVSGNSLAYPDGIMAIETKFGEFYSKYYQDDAHESCILSAAYENSETYDTRAFVVDADIAGGLVATDSVFILDAPNMTGIQCSYTNYSGSTGQYKLAYEENYSISENSTVNAWVIRATDGEDTPVAYSVDTELGDGMTWVTVE